MSIVISTSANIVYDCLIYQYVCNIKTSFSLLLYICFSLERLIINIFLLFSGALVARSLVLYVVFCGSLFVLLSIVLFVLLSIVLSVLLSIVLSVLLSIVLSVLLSIVLFVLLSIVLSVLLSIVLSVLLAIALSVLLSLVLSIRLPITDLITTLVSSNSYYVFHWCYVVYLSPVMHRVYSKSVFGV